MTLPAPRPVRVSLGDGRAPHARVLMFSQRNIYEPEVWRCSGREFEGMIGDIDTVDLLAPSPLKSFTQRRRLALRVGKHSRLVVNPGIPRARVDRRYDLFLAFCDQPFELLNVNAAVGEWREWCRTSVCWLNELWVHEMSLMRSSLRVLSKFDIVVCPLSQSIGAIAEAVDGKCLFLPIGVDAEFFSPRAEAVHRGIDVYSIGRRPARAHHALMRMAREGKIFYVYDTFSDLHTDDPDAHRFLVASMARRSRYFLVGPAKFDKPSERGGQSEWGARFFEGAAAGTIMIGERPCNERFDREFAWPDDVIELPPDSREIEESLRDLDRQPERQEHIRRTNVIQALRRHDWVYRWEAVLKAAGLEPMPELLERKTRLAALADRVLASRAPLPLGHEAVRRLIGPVRWEAKLAGHSGALGDGNEGHSND